MDDIVSLRCSPIDLNSDAGHAFVVDCTRAAEGLTTGSELQRAYDLSPADWQVIIKDSALIKKIQAERVRRVRSGQAAKEAAAHHFIKAPGILNGIMSNEQAPVRGRIEAIKELRQTAAVGSENKATESNHFSIVINLGADTERYEFDLTPPKQVENKPDVDE